MLRLMVIGSILLFAVIIALAAGPRVPPVGTPASSSDSALRMAGPPAVVDPQSRSTPPRPFLYDPCRTMAWVAWFGGCQER